MGRVTTEYCSELVSQLIDGIDNGDFNDPENIPDKYTWEHLLGLLCIAGSIDGGVDLFKQLYDIAIKAGEANIRRKKANGETIRVYFQSYSAAQWPGDGVYKRFKDEPGFDAKILVCPLADRDNASILDSYRKTYNWYKDNGYNIFGGLDMNTMEVKGWDKVGEIPDVVYQVSSWFDSLDPSLWFTKLPLRTLHAYIPYSIYLCDSKNGEFAKRGIYDKEIMNLMWRVYCDSTYNLRGYEKYQLLRGKNARYSGYAKMDVLYNKKEYSDEELSKLWSVPEGISPSKIKKVIIAPHFSIFDEGLLLLSTFKKNAYFLLYLAQKYKEQVSFVFKPHPNLRLHSVNSGFFKSYEEYDNYVKAWDDLPNGKAVQEADYLEYFATSDGMIMDSGSFLGEYLYTGKPLLFLTRPEQSFMEIGKKVVESYYRTPGENYLEIEKFLTDVILDGDDPMEGKRKATFSEEYDYITANGVEASKYIVNDVLNLCPKEG